MEKLLSTSDLFWSKFLVFVHSEKDFWAKNSSESKGYQQKVCVGFIRLILYRLFWVSPEN
jgi:hypothetical protein